MAHHVALEEASKKVKLSPKGSRLYVWPKEELEQLVEQGRAREQAPIWA